MPSPFPGMDPYLEDPKYWGGVHTKLIGSINTVLNRELPEGYFADIEEHIWLQTDESEDRELLGKPDVFLMKGNGKSRNGTSGGIAVFEPTTHAVLPAARRKTQKYVKVLAPDHFTVVTAIEILSPTNKSSGRTQYLAKREEYFAARINLVEIDLLRDGERMPMGRPTAPGGDYYFLVSRSFCFPEIDVWQFTTRDKIPPIPIPLKERDGDIALNLQESVEDMYDLSRYAQRIDYSLPPVPPLRSTDAAWAAELLKKATRKKKK
jgi:hypothetical protein